MTKRDREIMMGKDVTALICDRCGEAEWTRGFKLDRCDHEGPICWTAADKAPRGKRDRIQALAGRADKIEQIMISSLCQRAFCKGDHNAFKLVIYCLSS